MLLIFVCPVIIIQTLFPVWDFINYAFLATLYNIIYQIYIANVNIFKNESLLSNWFKFSQIFRFLFVCFIELLTTIMSTF